MDAVRDCLSKYQEWINNKKEESIEDQSETEPDRSPNKASTFLLEAKDLIKKNLENLSTSDFEYQMFKAALTAVLLEIGVAHLNAEEFSKAEEYFADCLESIPDPLDPLFVVSSINVRNQLGFLWSKKSELLEAKKWLEEAENLYLDFRKVKGKVSREIFDVFEDVDAEGGERKLEEGHTFTKFFLAQVYAGLNERVKSAVCCHETLKRKLIFNKYGPIKWALCSIGLSAFFLKRGLVKQARHHLAAASYVLNSFEDTLKDLEGTQEEIDAKREEFQMGKSEVSWNWVTYGTFLLANSNNLAQKPDDEETVEENYEDLESLCFDNFDLSSYENQIADSAPVTFENARDIFLFSQKHLNIAKEYYTLEDRASSHVQIVRDHSELFRFLTMYEPNLERQFKMLKKRAVLLEGVLKELNPRYYLDLCRQLWFDLGKIYLEMHYIKLSNKNPTPEALRKVNSLIERGIYYFSSFINSLKDDKTKELPDEIPEDLIRPLLEAHFYVGALYNKLVTQDERNKKENATKAYEYCKYLVDKCEQSEKFKNEAGEIFESSKSLAAWLKITLGCL